MIPHDVERIIGIDPLLHKIGFELRQTLARYIREDRLSEASIGKGQDKITRDTVSQINMIEKSVSDCFRAPVLFLKNGGYVRWHILPLPKVR
jgi:hypothetical protein